MKQTVVFKLARNQRVLNSWLGQRFFFSLSLIQFLWGQQNDDYYCVSLSTVLVWSLLRDQEDFSKWVVHIPLLYIYCIIYCRVPNRRKGSFTNYVDKILAFLTTYPPPPPPGGTFSIVWTSTKSGHFWTTYLPRFVNVVCERPQYNEVKLIVIIRK